VSELASRPKLLVTGANGNLGRRLLGAVADRFAATALVRSAQARETLERALGPGVADVSVVDYQDVAALKPVVENCAAVVHLVGILKENSRSSYHEAHEGATRALLDALGPAAHDTRIIYLSILGSHPDAANACLASKGRAERMLLDTAGSSLVIQVPMVMGEGDYASQALRSSASAKINLTFRGASREQPVYAGDVADAIEAALHSPDVAGTVLRLAGPESLARRELIGRAAATLGRQTYTVSLPFWVGTTLAWALERLLPNPPLTRAMLGVLDHDDAIDPGAACRALGLVLTPLDEMLGRCLGGADSGELGERSER
jgi:NADH dehydrogenase